MRQNGNAECQNAHMDDIDQALSALSDSLPVRVERFTPLWTRIVAR